MTGVILLDCELIYLSFFVFLYAYKSVKPFGNC